MKKVNITISEDNLTQINEIYPVQKDGLQNVINNYLILRSSALQSLKGIFDREELITLLDIHNATMFSPRFSTSKMLIAHLEDADKLENVCSRQGSDFEKLKKKISKLSHTQSLVLIESCWSFWYGPNQAKDLEGFYQSFL